MFTLNNDVCTNTAEDYTAYSNNTSLICSVMEIVICSLLRHTNKSFLFLFPEKG